MNILPTNIISHDRSNYYGVSEKTARLPHFLSNITNAYQGLQTLAKANQYSPTAGSLWQGTPISDMFVGKAHASEYTPPPATQTPPANKSGGSTNVVAGGYNAQNNLYNTAPASVNTSGGGGTSVRDQMLKGLIPWDDNVLNSSQNQVDQSASLRNEISSSWDNYLNSLQGTSGYLDEQRAAQEGIARSQLQQGIDTANTQKAASLKDIANTTRNAFQAGNNYLGSLGAGDSSAANQYSFAINQQAGKQTGDLNNFVNTQIKDLTSQHDQQIQQIASWFAGKQQELKSMMAQGQLSKGQDLANLSKQLLDQAMQATNQIKANSQNQYNALVEWAASNSQNMGQLQSNIAQIPQAMGALQLGAGGMGGTPAYGGGVPSASDRTDIFGRPLRA